MHRLAPDFSTDASRWSAKTGTLLNLRHEAGVVEHADGQAYVVVALTESRIPASAHSGLHLSHDVFQTPGLAAGLEGYRIHLDSQLAALASRRTVAGWI